MSAIDPFLPLAKNGSGHSPYTLKYKSCRSERENPHFRFGGGNAAVAIMGYSYMLSDRMKNPETDRKGCGKPAWTYREGNYYMKRSVLIAALAALTLVGCGKEAPPPPPPAPVQAPEAAPPPPPAPPAAEAAKEAAPAEAAKEEKKK